MKQPAAKIRSLMGRPSEIENIGYMKFFLLLLCFLGVFAGYGQDYCDPSKRPAGVGEGGFKIVGTSIGCAPFDVSVEKTVGESALYIYDYKGGILPKPLIALLELLHFDILKRVFIEFYNLLVMVQAQSPAKKYGFSTHLILQLKHAVVEKCK
ncbi:MAG: hypothetical protein R2822_15780 [Spirosomataceae bacterium]